LPAKKKIDVLEKGVSLADRDNMVYLGTIVENGWGKAVVIKTGEDTELGNVSSMVREAEEKETKKTLDKIEKILSKMKEWNKENIRSILIPEAEKEGDRGKLLWPFRTALTGKKASADPFEIAEILGKEKAIKRIKQAKDLLK